MKVKYSHLGLLLLSGTGLLTAGCGGGSNAVALPSYDPDGSAEQAMEMYDTNGDGFLAGEELDSVPSIKQAMFNIDTDKDQKVSLDEITERIRTWADSEVGLMSVSCEVFMNGQPLNGATVTFTPEPFLGDVIKDAIGETGMGSTARPKIPKDQRPSPDSPPGIQPGFYKVVVSKQQNGEELVPAKYNSETTLGQQISRDDPAIVNKRVIFSLKSK